MAMAPPSLLVGLSQENHSPSPLKLPRPGPGNAGEGVRNAPVPLAPVDANRALRKKEGGRGGGPGIRVLDEDQRVWPASVRVMFAFNPSKTA